MRKYLMKDLSKFDKSDRLQRGINSNFFEEEFAFCAPEEICEKENFKKLDAEFSIRSVYTNVCIALDGMNVFHVEVPEIENTEVTNFGDAVMSAIQDKIVSMVKNPENVLLSELFTLMLYSQIQLMGLLYENDNPVVYFQIIFRDTDFNKFAEYLKDDYEVVNIKEAGTRDAYKKTMIEVTSE